MVGFAGMLFVGADGHVTTIAVDEAWQRRQIGTRLMLALSREAIERGATALTLEVRAGNEPAQAMYRRLRLRPGRHPPQLLRRDRRGCPRHVGPRRRQPRLRRARLDAIEAPSRPHRRRGTSTDSAGAMTRHPGARHRDVVRRDGGRRRGRRHARPLVGGEQPGRAARPLRRGGARDRQPGPRRAAHPGGGPGPGRGRHQRRPRRRGGRHGRPRSGRRPARRRERGQGPGPGVGRAVRGRQPPRGPPLRRASWRSPTSSCPSWCCWCRAATPC